MKCVISVQLVAPYVIAKKLPRSSTGWQTNSLSTGCTNAVTTNLFGLFKQTAIQFNASSVAEITHLPFKDTIYWKEWQIFYSVLWCTYEWNCKKKCRAGLIRWRQMEPDISFIYIVLWKPEESSPKTDLSIKKKEKKKWRQKSICLLKVNLFPHWSPAWMHYSPMGKIHITHSQHKLKLLHELLPISVYYNCVCPHGTAVLISKCFTLICCQNWLLQSITWNRREMSEAVI